MPDERPKEVITIIVAAAIPDAVLPEEVFEDESHRLIRAATAEDLLAKARLLKPGLILLDAKLGDTPALALLPEILMESAGTAVIVVADQGSVPEAVQAIKLGAADYLEQPVDPVKIRSALDDHLRLL